MKAFLPKNRDKTLFTPGPLSTSQTVKQAMLRDLGSRDMEFERLVKDIEARLLSIASVDKTTHAAILMQGSGTFGVESVIGSAISETGSLLVIENGAYGRRLRQIAQVLRIPVEAIHFAENQIISVAEVEKQIASSKASHVAMVHCETSTGVFNPIETIGAIAHNYNKSFIVDAMSSFGAVKIDLSHIDFLVSSANKCLEGVPGFSFIIANISQLAKLEGRARSLSLDLYAQWQSLATTGQFRFTPPTHAFLAFHQALKELEQEGGVLGRAQRYQENHQIIASGLKELGFKEYLSRELQGYIITSFRYPENPKFIFKEFYQKLNERGLVIYPGKVGDADCFRIGNIGRIFAEDMRALLLAVKEVKQEMGF